MARDNSPKERQRQQLERKLARRASYNRILIVSEGSKTEPNYFGEIRQARLREGGNACLQHHPGAGVRGHATCPGVGGQVQCADGARAVHCDCRAGGVADPSSSG